MVFHCIWNKWKLYKWPLKLSKALSTPLISSHTIKLTLTKICLMAFCPFLQVSGCSLPRTCLFSLFNLSPCLVNCQAFILFQLNVTSSTIHLKAGPHCVLFKSLLKYHLLWPPYWKLQLTISHCITLPLFTFLPSIFHFLGHHKMNLSNMFIVYSPLEYKPQEDRDSCLVPCCIPSAKYDTWHI